MLIIAALLLLAGCGSDEPETVEGNGYSVEVPEDWDDASERAEEAEFAGFTPDVILVGDRDEGFTVNINVIRESSLREGIDIDEYVTAARDILEEGEFGGEQVPGTLDELGEPEEGTLDGEESRTFDHTRTIEDKRVKARQVTALHDGVGYTITYTALADNFDDEADKLDEVVESWKWE